MLRTEKFTMILSLAEKAALQNLAEVERLSAAATICRLVWREAEQRGLLTLDGQPRNHGKADGWLLGDSSSIARPE
jgi:hypothetical protein